MPKHIVGLDCASDVSEVRAPFLTVVDQPAETFGSLGASCFSSGWRARPVCERGRIVLQTDLIIRKSCCVKAGVPVR